LVFAVPAAESPFCKITGKIISVSSQEDGTRPGGYPIAPHFSVSAEITSVTTEQEEGTRTCEDIYVVGEQQTFIVMANSMKTNLSPDDVFTGTSHFSGDEWFGGHFLSNIDIMNDANTGTVIITTTSNNNNINEKNTFFPFLIAAVLIFILAIIAIYAFHKKI
jgi:hypothetical protein